MSRYFELNSPGFEFSHTSERIYAIVKDGKLKHLAYYDKKHRQSVSIELAHPHNGIQPHRHVYLSHNKKTRCSTYKRGISSNKENTKGVSLKMRINEYNSLKEFANMNDALNSTCIEGIA